MFGIVPDVMNDHSQKIKVVGAPARPISAVAFTLS